MLILGLVLIDVSAAVRTILNPILAAVDNGLLAEDLTSVTFNLLEGVTWSDGEPFTAEDVVFSWEWNVDPANQSIDSVSWEIISNVEAVDDLGAGHSNLKRVLDLEPRIVKLDRALTTAGRPVFARERGWADLF